MQLWSQASSLLSQGGFPSSSHHVSVIYARCQVGLMSLTIFRDYSFETHQMLLKWDPLNQYGTKPGLKSTRWLRVDQQDLWKSLLTHICSKSRFSLLFMVKYQQRGTLENMFKNLGSSHECGGCLTWLWKKQTPMCKLIFKWISNLKHGPWTLSAVCCHLLSHWIIRLVNLSAILAGKWCHLLSSWTVKVVNFTALLAG